MLQKFAEQNNIELSALKADLAYWFALPLATFDAALHHPELLPSNVAAYLSKNLCTDVAATDEDDSEQDATDNEEEDGQVDVGQTEDTGQNQLDPEVANPVTEVVLVEKQPAVVADVEPPKAEQFYQKWSRKGNK